MMPCEDGCQLGHGDRCYALRTTRRFCELIAMGRDDYRAYVDRRTRDGEGDVASEAEQVRLRKAAKPRVPLGTRAKPDGD